VKKFFGYAPVIFDDKIWLLGCNRNEQFTSQVLVSGTAKNWQDAGCTLDSRGGIAATVYKEKFI
jgi:hypothetical protein